MATFTAVIIIYNPNSTGPSRRIAEECQYTLQKVLKKTPVELLPTQYAGHAEELAYEYAHKSKRPLIISSSGDGGYHEVVNGILQANHEGAKAVAGLLPGGNANDHYASLHNLYRQDFIESVVRHKVRKIDILKLSATRNGEPFTRYAHSYIGLGLTPRVGRRLTKAKLNRWNEMVIVLRSLLALRTSRLIVDGKEQSYRSLVFTNIGRMAKILNLAHESRVDDGKFEVSALYRRSRAHLILSLFRASLMGLPSTKQVKRFSFKTVNRTLIQLDGEVRKLDADTTATVSIQHRALNCIV